MRHPAHRSADFSFAWYLVLVLPCALVIGLTFITGLHELEQPSAAAPAETVALPLAA